MAKVKFDKEETKQEDLHTPKKDIKHDFHFLLAMPWKIVKKELSLFCFQNLAYSILVLFVKQVLQLF